MFSLKRNCFASYMSQAYIKSILEKAFASVVNNLPKKYVNSILLPQGM